MVSNVSFSADEELDDDLMPPPGAVLVRRVLLVTIFSVISLLMVVLFWMKGNATGEFSVADMRPSSTNWCVVTVVGDSGRHYELHESARYCEILNVGDIVLVDKFKLVIREGAPVVLQK